MNDCPELAILLKLHFGKSAFRPGQQEIIESVLAGRDTVAILPTGGGKSLCYQLPAVARAGVVLVISPLIALMRDQTRELEARGIPCGCLHAGQSSAEKHRVFEALRRSPRFLLYLSPERVQKEGFTRWLKAAPVSLFAIDECHCVSQWGPDFRPDYAKLTKLRELRPEIPILALTASATPAVENDLCRALDLRSPSRHRHGFYRPNLYCEVRRCGNEQAKVAYLLAAVAGENRGRILVYCGTRAQSEAIAGALARRVPGVGYYHAGLSPERRRGVERDFAGGGLRVLTATSAFGMGIDLPDLRLILHHQIPSCLESYYQEMGRAGRDGDPSTCCLLFSPEDERLHTYFIRKSDASRASKARSLSALAEMTAYAEGETCRHRKILAYFGDRLPETRGSHCGHCDVCAPRAGLSLGRGENPAAGPEAPEARRRWERLRLWRRGYALAQAIPESVLPGDRALEEIACHAPATLEEMGRVTGFGKTRLAHFGNLILEALNSGD